MTVLDAVLAFAVAFVVTLALTPLARRLAVRMGAVDAPRERGLSERETPLLGGLAIFAGGALAGVAFLPLTDVTRGVVAGALLITLVGALDDRFELAPGVKLAGQFGAALIPVLNGVAVHHITLPFLGALNLGQFGGDALTLIGLVGVMNIVNFSDGVDGLAAGVCAISAVTFAIIAFDLERNVAGGLAAITAGAALAFLVYNFEPASVFMGDCGSNLLGLMLGCIAIEGTIKTPAVVALVFPLVVLAVPFLDTGFVVAKRIKYGRPVYSADTWHFHHRFTNIGFSKTKTVLYLYAWTLTLAALALALRFVPYSDHHGHLHAGWSVVLGLFGLLALGASVYLVAVLEIVKFRGLRSFQLRKLDPETSEHAIDEQVAHELETGELRIVAPAPNGADPSSTADRTPPASKHP